MDALDRLTAPDVDVIDLKFYKLIDVHGKRTTVRGLFCDDVGTIEPNQKACQLLEEALDLEAGGASRVKLFADVNCELKLQRALVGDQATLNRMIRKTRTAFNLTGVPCLHMECSCRQSAAPLHACTRARASVFIVGSCGHENMSNTG